MLGRQNVCSVHNCSGFLFKGGAGLRIDGRSADATGKRASSAKALHSPVHKAPPVEGQQHPRTPEERQRHPWLGRRGRARATSADNGWVSSKMSTGAVVVVLCCCCCTAPRLCCRRFLKSLTSCATEKPRFPTSQLFCFFSKAEQGYASMGKVQMPPENAHRARRHCTALYTKLPQSRGDSTRGRPKSVNGTRG